MKNIIISLLIIFSVCCCSTDGSKMISRDIPTLLKKPIQDSLVSFICSVGQMPTLEQIPQVFSIVAYKKGSDTIIQMISDLSAIDWIQETGYRNRIYTGATKILNQYLHISIYDQIGIESIIIDTNKFTIPIDTLRSWGFTRDDEGLFQRFPSWRKYRYSSGDGVLELLDKRVGDFEKNQKTYNYWIHLEETNSLSFCELKHMFTIISRFDEKTDSFFLYKANDMVFKYLYYNPCNFINTLRIVSPTKRKAIYAIIQEGPVKVAYQDYPEIILSKLEDANKRSAIKDSIIKCIHEYKLRILDND